ncbi:hypothetical protein EMN47_14185 [Prolixibacteraceae bacterium JC049]|nr:hypothetical protein [Prolixibacteraceae bacterium JC049]
MKGKLKVILIIAISVAIYSCNQTEKRDLVGKYVVGGFHMRGKVNLDSLNRCGGFNFGGPVFDFRSNDSVYLAKAFGEKYFKGTTFMYELTSERLIFTKGAKRIEMDYVDDGVFRVFIDDSSIDRLDLVKDRKSVKGKQ